MNRIGRALGLVVVVAISLWPFYALVHILVSTASGDEGLDRNCKPKTVQASVFELLSPSKFWANHVQYLEKELAVQFRPPSEQIRKEASQAMELLKELQRDQPLPKYEGQQSYDSRRADELRAAADELEIRSELKRLDAIALEEYLQKHREASACLIVAKAKLRDALTE